MFHGEGQWGGGGDGSGGEDGGGGVRRARSSGFGYAMALKLTVVTGKESTI